MELQSLVQEAHMTDHKSKNMTIYFCSKCLLGLLDVTLKVHGGA